MEDRYAHNICLEIVQNYTTTLETLLELPVTTVPAEFPSVDLSAQNVEAESVRWLLVLR